MYKTIVFITFQVEGMHCWPEAKDVFPEVGFLSDPHRHIFHFKMEKLVTHSDRDIEFILWKRDVQDWLHDKFGDEIKRLHNFGRMSCEQIAKLLLEKFECESVEVSEDNENGAKIIRQ